MTAKFEKAGFISELGEEPDSADRLEYAADLLKSLGDLLTNTGSSLLLILLQLTWSVAFSEAIEARGEADDPSKSEFGG